MNESYRSTADVIINRKMNPIVLTNKEKQPSLYKDGVRNMIENYKWKWFLTLTFKYEVRDRIKVENAIDNFINKLSVEAFRVRGVRPSILQPSALLTISCNNARLYLL